MKIKTLEHFQTKLEGNQVDYTTKPKLYNKSGKNDIRHNTGPYQEDNTSNNIKKNQTQQQKSKNTKTNTTNTTRFDDNPTTWKSSNNWRCSGRQQTWS